MLFENREDLIADEISEAIWKDSSGRDFQRAFKPVKKIGAQQFMFDAEEEWLPWVPDLVGKDWERSGRNALLIVGSAYAGILLGHSTRAIPISCYRRCQNANEFHDVFHECIIKPDIQYYLKIEALLTDNNGKRVWKDGQICLTDLCKASFVKRQGKRDKQGDRVAKRSAKLFSKHVGEGQDPTPAKWLKDRLETFPGSVIITLGSIAEHGLLRAVTRLYEDYTIQPRCRPGELFSRSDDEDGKWVSRYAHTSLNMSHWINCNAGCWWEVKDNGKVRWRILPIYHPNGGGWTRPNLEKTKEVLNRMCKGVRDEY